MPLPQVVFTSDYAVLIYEGCLLTTVERASCCCLGRRCVSYVRRTGVDNSCTHSHMPRAGPATNDRDKPARELGSKSIFLPTRYA